MRTLLVFRRARNLINDEALVGCPFEPNSLENREWEVTEDGFIKLLTDCFARVGSRLEITIV